ncbi:hypothetical protein IC229_34170 [Spirosoma sp. BT702]|uniref:Arm DNA-binding domain-containing protein n=1 Tax=Spirosoma profusum TaxID=2771354 RepID=A0A927AWG5_9BACT|nr:hypothetical protein [Spirosoma profusum]MBD2705705.1 hypothetical protein [Spirosoma profusum]
MYHINRMCVLFWFRKSLPTTSKINPKSKIQDDPEGFIQMRITYNADREELGSTHIECRKSQWDQTNQCFKGKSIWALEQNKKLSNFKQRIEKLTEELERDNDELTVFLVVA